MISGLKDMFKIDRVSNSKQFNWIWQSGPPSGIMNPVDPTYRPYGEVINVMTVIEELRANLSFPLEMQTSTRKSIYKNTRGPNPLYKPEALPSRTM